MSQILRHSPDLKDTVVLHVPRELQKALDRQNAQLFLQAHEGRSSLGMLLFCRMQEHERMGANPEGYLSRLTAEARRRDPPLLHSIDRDKMSLLALRDYTKLGLPICCVVHFTAKGRQFGFVSPTMFEFAKRLRIPKVSVKSSVTDTGEIKFCWQPPQTGLNGGASAQDVIEFYNSSGHTRTKLEVRNYDG